MKTPVFWYKPQGLFSTLLWPFGWLYGQGGQLISTFKKPQRFQIPIISIGSIVCGGSGKTPIAIALMKLLTARGYKVHFVSRGYGGKEQGPLAVDPSEHKAWDVGDEPLLLAQYAPTWVAKKRFEGVKKAMEDGAQLIILDDGHQTNIYKDVSIVVIDLLQGFGNGCVIPAGPLRETLSEGLKRADGFMSVGEGELNSHRSYNFSTPHPQDKLATSPTRGEVSLPMTHLSSRDTGEKEVLDEESPLPLWERSPEGRVRGIKPFFKAKIVSQSLTIPSNRVVAFCGLGFPQKFYMSLKELGLELIATETFPDHYQYKNVDLLRLQELAQKHNSVLVTTRKDLVKIPASWQKQLHVLDISIDFEDAEKLCDFILHKIYPPLERT